MLDKTEAIIIAKEYLPQGKIEAVVEYEGLYLLQIFTPDPLEGDYDPFFSVNKDTGEFRDFSILTDGNITEISNLFLRAKE